MSEVNVETKHCPRCNRDKSSEEFGKNKAARDGLASYCKSCTASYRAANRERINATARRCYANNREERLDKAKKYADEHREEVRERNRLNYHRLYKEQRSA